MYCCTITNTSELKNLPNVDVLELRVDLLKDTSMEGIQKEIESIRRKTDLPLLFNLLPEREGGKFPNMEKDVFERLDLATKLGCEYVQVGIEWEKKSITRLIRNKGKSKIIAAFYNYKKTYSLYGLKNISRRCLQTKADIIRVVMTAESVKDNEKIFSLLSFIQKKYKKPVISYCLGEHGKLSITMSEKMGSYMTFLDNSMNLKEIKKCEEIL